MKKLILTAVFASLGVWALAQDGKNTLRAGMGVSLDRANIVFDEDLSSKTEVGPSLYIGYTRLFNQWFSLSGGFSLSNNSLNKKVLADASNNVTIDAENTVHHFTADIDALFRPFFKIPVLNRLEIGGGVTLDYLQEREQKFGNMFYSIQNGTVSYTSDPAFSVEKTNKLCPGIIAKARIHVLETNSIDFSLDFSYRLLRLRKQVNNMRYDGFYYFTACALIGIKF